MEESPNECCGVVLENDGHFITKKCINVSQNPTYHCVVSEEDLKNKKVSNADIMPKFSSSPQYALVLKYGLSINKLDKNIKVTKSVDLKFFFRKIKKRIGIDVAKKI